MRERDASIPEHTTDQCAASSSLAVTYLSKRAKQRLRGRFKADRLYALRRWREGRIMTDRAFNADRAAVPNLGDDL